MSVTKRQRGFRGALVVAEVSMTVVLLIAAGLLLRSYYALGAVSPGFDASGLLVAETPLPPSKYADPSRRRALVDDVLARLQNAPGVVSAGYVNYLPLTFPGGRAGFDIEGRLRPPLGEGPQQMAVNRAVSPRYLEALGVPLLRGRHFEDGDGPDAPPVVIINRTMARTFWGVADPLGRRILFGPPGSPWLTIVGVVGEMRQIELALGIGATAAIFSVVYSVLIKPLPYPNADELVRIRHPAPGMNVEDLGADSTMYSTYRDENRTLAGIGLWFESSATMTGVSEPDRVRALVVSHGTLQALGVQPVRGRWFTEPEHGPVSEGPAPVILSYGFWQRRFGSDEAVLGREFSIDSRPSQVVGIMPRDFRFLDATPQPDVILAMRIDPARQAIGNFGFHLLARLRPGATLDQAHADLERALPIWLDAWPLIPGVSLTKRDVANLRITPTVRALKDDLVGDVASTLWVLMGAIGAVLLIACANIANLMLVRADARRQEFAVRAALGAAPARIARQLLIESLCLGAAGGVLGSGLAWVGLRGLVAIGPSNLPRLQEISVYPPVLAFTVAVSLASTLLFGSIMVVKHALRIDMPVIGSARGASRERSITRNTLVVVQVALALVLVVSAALMIRTFQALRGVDPGFSNASTIQTVRMWMPTALLRDPEQYTRVQHQILDTIAALPGVTSVGLVNTLPMEGPAQTGSPLLVDGHAAAAGTPPLRRFKFVSPGYFDAMGTRVIAGRDLTWRDIEAGGRVAVISERFARELAAEPAGALGKRIRPVFGEDAWREVVGVVQSIHEDALYEEPSSFVYWPVLGEDFFGRPAFGTPNVAFVIRSKRAGTASLMNDVRQAVRLVSGSIPIGQERTMQDYYADSLARTSFTLVMLAIAGGMALVLGIIGIYGVIAYVVSQRTREIGIRSALGASPRELERMFLRHGLALSGVGAAAGLVAALASGRVMSSLLFGIGPMDPPAYAAAVGVTVAAAALASYVPARRAATLAPMATMKVME